jgi:uncharacterized protein (DUF1499 family)
MNILVGIAAAVALVVAGGIAFVRLTPDDASLQHLDPLAAARTGKPNDVLLAPDGTPGAARPAPVWEGSPRALMEALNEIALAAPRVRLLAGSPGELFATYVQRSRIVGYPDYISVRALPAGDGKATLAIYSRSRWGSSDFGVNAGRVSAWLGAIPLPEAR